MKKRYIILLVYILMSPSIFYYVTDPNYNFATTLGYLFVILVGIALLVLGSFSLHRIYKMNPKNLFVDNEED